jgi:hypothetical protein
MKMLFVTVLLSGALLTTATPDTVSGNEDYDWTPTLIGSQVPGTRTEEKNRKTGLQVVYGISVRDRPGPELQTPVPQPNLYYNTPPPSVATHHYNSDDPLETDSIRPQYLQTPDYNNTPQHSDFSDYIDTPQYFETSDYKDTPQNLDTPHYNAPSQYIQTSVSENPSQYSKTSHYNNQPAPSHDYTSHYIYAENGNNAEQLYSNEVETGPSKQGSILQSSILAKKRSIFVLKFWTISTRKQHLKMYPSDLGF